MTDLNSPVAHHGSFRNFVQGNQMNLKIFDIDLSFTTIIVATV